METLQMPSEDQRMVSKNKNVTSSSVGSVLTTTSSQADPYAEEAEILDWTEETLTNEHLNMIDKANCYKPGKAEIHYDYLASNYEGIYNRLFYPDPEKLAELAAKQFVKDPKNKKAPTIDISTLKVLDLGCGTGLVGQALYNKGFRQIVGADISNNMMGIAEEKQVYTAFHQVDLTECANLPEDLWNQFDIVTCSGLINCHHMNYQLFELMTLALKKGGLAIFTGSYSTWGTFWYNGVLKEMVNEQRWDLVCEDLYANYGGVSPAPGRFYKGQGKAFCFKNLQDNKKTWVTRSDEKFFEKMSI